MSKPKDPELRREDIIKAAMALFREEGFEKTTVDGIAKKAGIAKGSVYNYFKSKESVYEAIISDLSMRMLSKTKDILTDSNVSPKQRIINYIDFSFALGEKGNMNLSKVLGPSSNDTAKVMYTQALESGTWMIIPVLQSVLEEGSCLGEFRIGDAQFSAVALMGAFQKIHVAYYKLFDMDFVTSRKYLNDLLSRLLGTNF
ncbi:AcrR family transcriptional regulator [Anaerotaenia torta]|uniref:TetR/AcrR family transcriptional regulator n=1 Tax=Anaerotaenia torta TaxID=433293 RepID=UPI003D2416F6